MTTCVAPPGWHKAVPCLTLRAPPPRLRPNTLEGRIFWKTTNRGWAVCLHPTLLALGAFWSPLCDPASAPAPPKCSQSTASNSPSLPCTAHDSTWSRVSSPGLPRSVQRHIRVASKQELKDRIMAAVDFFNQNAVAHTWTYTLDKAA